MPLVNPTHSLSPYVRSSLFLTRIGSLRTFSTSHYSLRQLGGEKSSSKPGNKLVKREKKYWMERWFGLTKEQRTEAGFSEVKRLLLLGKQDWRLFSVAIVLLIISSAIVMALPKVTGSILDATKKYDKLEDISLYGFTLNEFMAIMAGLLLLSTFTTFGRIIILRVLGEKLVSRLRSRIMKKTLRQDMTFFDENKVGDLISRLSSDAYVVSKSITQNLSDGIKYTIVGASAVSMMFMLSPKLSVILLAFAPPLLFASYVYGLKIRAISRALQQSTGSLTKVAEEQLNSIKTIQSFTAETKELTRYDDRIRDVFRISYKDAVTNATFFASTGVIGNITLLLTLGLGTFFVMDGSMTVGGLTAYLMYTEYCGSATFGIANFYTELFKGAGAASRLFELLDQDPDIDGVEGEKLKTSKGHIKFEKVDFSYPTRPDNMVFRNLNLEIKPGSNVCIVGPSGRGKSTIASLLLRFYNPDSGKITIDGEDISKYSVHSIRQVIGFVQQEPVLMPGSIRDNIVYGMPPGVKITGDMIEWAAAKANCDFIDQFPDRFDTDIGPRGSLLSGGQKQKIAIARCLIKEPRIMILDEATSALDSRSENAINTTLARLLRDQSMTTVSIAHRKSTIEKCDDVLVLGYDGNIVEEGRYDELYSNKDSRLYKLLNETSPNNVASEAQLRKKESERKRKEEEALKECETKPTVLSKEEVEKLSLEERSLAAENFSEEGVEMNDEFGHKLMIPHHVGTEEFILHAAADREEAEKIRLKEEKQQEKKKKKMEEEESKKNNEESQSDPDSAKKNESDTVTDDSTDSTDKPAKEADSDAANESQSKESNKTGTEEKVRT